MACCDWVCGQVALLDTDVLAVDSPDDIFSCGDYCAVMRHSNMFNSGVMVLRPSTAHFDRILRMLTTWDPLQHSHKGGDQVCASQSTAFNTCLAQPTPMKRSNINYVKHWICFCFVLVLLSSCNTRSISVRNIHTCTRSQKHTTQANVELHVAPWFRVPFSVDGTEAY